MSSEEFEKLQEIYRALYDELKLMPERAQKSSGGNLPLRGFCPGSAARWTLHLTRLCVFPEERKRLVRTFDERQGEAEEVVRMLWVNRKLKGKAQQFHNGVLYGISSYKVWKKKCVLPLPPIGTQ